jgi:hypothetical protein
MRQHPVEPFGANRADARLLRLQVEERDRRQVRVIGPRD